MYRAWIVLACLAIVGCGGTSTTGPSPVNTPPPVAQTGTIRYQVEGPMVADITYENSSGGISQETKVALPWTNTFTAQKGQLLQLSAFNASIPDVNGRLIVTIFVNGVAFKQAFADGGLLTSADVSGTF